MGPATSAMAQGRKIAFSNLASDSGAKLGFVQQAHNDLFAEKVGTGNEEVELFDPAFAA